MPNRLIFFAVAVASFMLGAVVSGTAQSYPGRAIKIIVAGVAGSPVDIQTRMIADKLSARLAQPIVVENRTGAAGNLGAEAVAKAAPDGYTLLVVLDTTLTVNPSLYQKLPFDPERDFRPISILAVSSTMLVVHPSVPVKSVSEFVAFAKTEPVPYAHGGNGSPGHLSMEYFRLQAGFQAIPVPYRGNAPLVTDLVAGQIKSGFVGTAGVIEHVRAGRLKGLAISARSRSPLAPDVPTLAEVGYPDFNVELYYVMLAPAAVPESITALLEREVRQALQSPDLREKFRAQGTEIVASTAIEAKTRVEADAKMWAKVVKAANMRLE
jgi:tripartite-type tricarboxylate transporter receptor subunit TctC